MGINGVPIMKTEIKYIFDEDDQEQDVAAQINGPKLAMCIYDMKNRIRSEWEECEEGGLMDKLISDIDDIIFENIGSIDLYTY